MTENRFIVIETTIDNDKDARKIASELIDLGLAACVQMNSIESTFIWNDSPMRDDEYLLRIKTSVAMFDECEALINQLHPYECPEIIAIPIISGSISYLNWMNEQLSS